MDQLLDLMQIIISFYGDQWGFVVLSSTVLLPVLPIALFFIVLERRDLEALRSRSVLYSVSVDDLPIHEWWGHSTLVIQDEVVLEGATLVGDRVYFYRSPENEDQMGVLMSSPYWDHCQMEGLA